MSLSDSSLVGAGEMGVRVVEEVGSLGMEIGERASGPNCASRNMKSRSRRSVGDRLAWKLRVGRAWEWSEWECLLADSMLHC